MRQCVIHYAPVDRPHVLDVVSPQSTKIHIWARLREKSGTSHPHCDASPSTPHSIRSRIHSLYEHSFTFAPVLCVCVLQSPSLCPPCLASLFVHSLLLPFLIIIFLSLFIDKSAGRTKAIVVAFFTHTIRSIVLRPIFSTAVHAL